jgi:hypothetical protein
MALPTAYLTSQKNLDGILSAIQAAKAPPKFTQQFLVDLGFSGNADRLVINMLKALRFLNGDGVPTQRYFDYLDQTQAERVMAEGVMDAYADLFAVNRAAHEMSKPELKNKMRTLSQGQLTDSVLDKMAMTFLAFAKNGDFKAANKTPATGGGDTGDSSGDDGGDGGGPEDDLGGGENNGGRLVVDGLIYNIQIQLPESRDPKVYDALFQSLKKHLSR